MEGPSENNFKPQCRPPHSGLGLCVAVRVQSLPRTCFAKQPVASAFLHDPFPFRQNHCGFCSLFYFSSNMRPNQLL
jgi:hypothetical protein